MGFQTPTVLPCPALCDVCSVNTCALFAGHPDWQMHLCWTCGPWDTISEALADASQVATEEFWQGGVVAGYHGGIPPKGGRGGLAAKASVHGSAAGADAGGDAREGVEPARFTVFPDHSGGWLPLGAAVFLERGCGERILDYLQGTVDCPGSAFWWRSVLSFMRVAVTCQAIYEVAAGAHARIWQLARRRVRHRLESSEHAGADAEHAVHQEHILQNMTL